MAEDARPDRHQDHAGDAEDDDGDRGRPVRSHPGDHPPDRRPEVHRLLADHAAHHRATTGSTLRGFDPLGGLELLLLKSFAGDAADKATEYRKIRGNRRM